MPQNPIQFQPGLSWRATTALHKSVHLVTDGLASFNAAGACVAEYGAIIVSLGCCGAAPGRSLVRKIGCASATCGIAEFRY